MEQSKPLSNLKTALATDLTSLSTIIKKQSPDLYDNTIKILQEALLMDQNNSIQILSKLLSHLLHCLQLKNLTNIVLNLLTKIITFLGLYKKPKEELKIDQILYHIIDLLSLLLKEREKSKLLQYKNSAEKTQLSLRIIQNVFTLINQNLLYQMEYNLLIRIYSICFECCIGDPIVQNIAVSALFTLTQSLFDVQNNSKIQQAFPILQCFLGHLFQNKKYNWMKNVQLKGLVWDLAIICVKGSRKSILKLNIQCSIIKNLKTMYQIAVQHIFASGEGSIFNTKNQKQSHLKNKQIASVSMKKGSLIDFIRFYRAFIFFSIFLWIDPVKEGNQGLVPFNHYIGSLGQICQIKQLGNKVYIILQGVCMLLINNHNLPLSTQKGMALIQIIAKISQQIYINFEFSQISNWDINYQYYLQKLCGQFGKISESDYIKLLRYTLVTIRKKYSLDETINSIHPISYTKSKSSNVDREEQEMTDRSNLSSVSDLQQIALNSSFSRGSNQQNNNQKTFSKRRWEKLIKLIIHIIRCLTSITLVDPNQKKSDKSKKIRNSQKQIGKKQKQSNLQKAISPRTQNFAQGPSRSVLQLLLQLQHWFILTPSSRIRNLILEELLTTVVQIQSHIETARQFQFQKICQCVQIGSNLMYGYYQCINATGFTLLLKMMALVHSQISEGRGLQQLQQVMKMVDRLYDDQNLMKTQIVFSTTAQGFIQCVSSIIADFQQQAMLSQKQINDPKQRSKRIVNEKRNSKMISYVLQKFMKVIVNNYRHLQKQWSFLTAFFITLCSNKNDFVKALGFSLIKPLVFDLLKIESHQIKMSQKIQKQLKVQYENQLKVQINNSQKLETQNKQSQLKYHSLRQDEIIGLYVQLSLANYITIQFLDQIRQILPMLRQQKAVIQIFKIISNLSLNKSHYKKELLENIKEIEELIMKEYLFKVTSVQYLKNVITSFAVCFIDKKQPGQIQSLTKIQSDIDQNIKNNDQYQLISLLWAVADHLKSIFVPDSKQKYGQLWTLIFSKFQLLAKNSKNLQFKQSVLHSLTQIIGQNTQKIEKNIIISTIQQVYMPLIYDLMELNNIFDFNSEINQQKCQQRIDMTKISIKNYLKLVKKLISQKLIDQQIVQKRCIMDQLNSKIIRFLQQNMNLNRENEYKKYQQLINDDYLCQICVLIDQTISQESLLELIDLKKINQLITTIKETMGTIDPQSLCYRKRLQPLYDKVIIKLQQIKKTQKNIQNQRQKQIQKQVKINE